MKKVSTLLPVLLISVVFFSCQKELSIDTSTGGNNNNGNNNNNSTSIEGNWNFLNLYMNITSSTGTNILGTTQKAVASYETTSIKNTGSISFADNKFAFTNFGYSISTTMHIASYTDQVKDFEQDVPFNFDIPSYSGSGKYQKIGNDSLYFPDGSLFQDLEINGQQITSSDPTGGKYAIKSDTLLLYMGMTVSKDSTVSQGGMSLTYRVDQKANIIGTFKKK